MVLIACCLFIVLGTALAAHAGIENDEALFAGPIYSHQSLFSIRMLHKDVPVMIMTYLGTLKTLLYWPLFSVFPPSLDSVRIPMVLAGAVTIALLYCLVRRIAGSRAALIATLLFATDPIFLLTNTFDWGPVALEHLLLVTGCLLLVRFAQDESASVSRSVQLAAGFFCFGLALWNKALFLWALAGLAIGALAVCSRELRKLFTSRRLAIAVVSFCTGALPFIIYNLRVPNSTLSSSAQFEIPNSNAKLLQLEWALDGSILFGFMTAPDDRQLKIPPRNSIALWITQYLGEHHKTGMLYAFGFCLLLAPLWWRSRAARFSLLFTAIAWFSMVLTRGAGGGTHHVVLLWPFPQIFVAATMAGGRWRNVANAAAIGLVALNLLVINQYFFEFETNGAGGSFTDALNSLSEALAKHTEEPVYITDWGMLYSLTLLQQGRLDLRDAEQAFRGHTEDESLQRSITSMFADRKAIFVGHTAGREVFIGEREGLERKAQQAGFRKDTMQVIQDSKGRDSFEIFRLVPL